MRLVSLNLLLLDVNLKFKKQPNSTTRSSDEFSFSNEERAQKSNAFKRRLLLPLLLWCGVYIHRNIVFTVHEINNSRI